jgi:hypothetical protein
MFSVEVIPASLEYTNSFQSKKRKGDEHFIL